MAPVFILISIDLALVVGALLIGLIVVVRLLALVVWFPLDSDAVTGRTFEPCVMTTSRHHADISKSTRRQPSLQKKKTRNLTGSSTETRRRYAPHFAALSKTVTVATLRHATFCIFTLET